MPSKNARVHHPKLNKSATVPASAVPAWERAGWQTVPEPDATAPAEVSAIEDTDPTPAADAPDADPLDPTSQTVKDRVTAKRAGK